MLFGGSTRRFLLGNQTLLSSSASSSLSSSTICLTSNKATKPISTLTSHSSSPSSYSSSFWWIRLLLVVSPSLSFTNTKYCLSTVPKYSHRNIFWTRTTVRSSTTATRRPIDFLIHQRSFCTTRTSIASTTSSSSTSFLTMTSSPNYKRVKLNDDSSNGTPNSSKIIGTHSGTFQADEAMGVWMLQQLPEYRNSKVIRSRDEQTLQPLDIVIDVGGIYNHELKRYDHHQRGYDERFEIPRGGHTTTKKSSEDDSDAIRCTKLSASGLVYRHYGKEVIKVFYPTISDEHLDWVYVKLYDSLLEALDAVDTGVEMTPKGTELVYKDSTGLASRVGRLNPRWNEKLEEPGADADTGTETLSPSSTSIDPDVRFAQASKLCGEDFLSVLTKIVESDIPAREIVKQAVLDRKKIHESGQVICFPSGGLPWKGHLYDIEKELGLDDDNENDDKLIKFVLYTDQAGKWRIQAVTVEGTLFENRLSLPESWRGLRNDELSNHSNIPGCIFVHANGFIGGNESYDGVLQMAKMTLSLQ